MTLEAPSNPSGTSPGHTRAGLIRLFLRSLPTMIGVSLLTLLLEHTGWFKGFETYALDSLFRMSSSQVSDDLVIVSIDDQDYHDEFGGSSPINAEALQKLLDAIEKGQPRVIGIDLDTSDKSFACVRSPHAVWARDARPVCAQSQDPLDQDAACQSEDIVRLSACGGTLQDTAVPQHDGTHIETDPPSGIVVFPQDDDGVVRRYRRTFHSDQAVPVSDVQGALDSLPWAIVKYYRANLAGKFPKADSTAVDPCPQETDAAAKEKEPVPPAGKIDSSDPLYADDEQELRLNFAGDHYRFDRVPARAVLQGAEQDYWKDNSPFKHAIVLVGGTYREARDAYITPVGSRFGVELIAQAIESDLKNGGIRDLNWIWALILDVVAGAILILLNWRFRGPKSIYLNLVAITVLSLAGSILAFGTAAYWFNFTSVLLGIWIHMIWDHAREHQAMKRELEAYRRGEHPPLPAHGA